MSAAVLFVCLRALDPLSFLNTFLRSFVGIVVVVGFPLAIGYLAFPGYLHMFGSSSRAFLYAYSPHRWLVAEVVGSLVCVVVYVFLKWPTTAQVGLLLAGIHFALWSWFAISADEKSLVIYPLLGFLATLAWGLDVRLSVGSSSPPQPMSAQASNL